MGLHVFVGNGTYFQLRAVKLDLLKGLFRLAVPVMPAVMSVLCFLLQFSPCYL